MEYVRKAISTSELERRWKLIRTLMTENDLDCVLLQGSNMHLGGYARWFTDVAAEYNLGMTVLFPKDGEMTLVRSSASPIPQWGLRGVEKVLEAPFAPTLNYTGSLEAGLVIDYLRSRACKRVGIIGPAFLEAGLILRVKESLPTIELVDITDEVDHFKAVKSDEEMDCVRATARIHDQVWSAFPAIAKPGMYEYQLRAEVIRLLMNLGSEEHLMFIGTAKQGKPCGMSTFQYSNRKMQEGDYGTLLMEVSGPGGYYCESARNFSFGEPCKAVTDAWEVAVKAQQFTADMLVPGRDSVEVVREYNKLVKSLGYSQEGRLYGHSQGYDLVERPAFMSYNKNGEETMKVMAGMNCSLHPYFIDEHQTVYINDNYYITETGAEKIHKTPPTIIIL